jgi:hypothetical protein
LAPAHQLLWRRLPGREGLLELLAETVEAVWDKAEQHVIRQRLGFMGHREQHLASLDEELLS